MTRAWFFRVILGVLLGLVLSVTLGPILKPTAAPVDTALPVAVPDNQGALDRVVLHYTMEAGPLVVRTYGELLATLDPSVRVAMVVEDDAVYADLLERLTAYRLDVTRMEPVVTGFPITPWSRDRYTLASDGQGGWYAIVPEKTDGAVAERANDWMVPWVLADHFDDVEVLAIPLRFDGGDLMVTHTHVFASAALLRKNLGMLVESREELVHKLEYFFGREVLLFGDTPDQVPIHHVGMYITPLPDGRILVGNPSLALTVLGRDRLEDMGADLSPDNLETFEHVAEAFRAAGFQVERLPMVPLEGGLNYLTYNNLLMEVRDGVWTAWVPTYGLDALDRLALGHLEAMGLAVHPVDVRRIFVHNGSVRCLVNVLSRA